MHWEAKRFVWHAFDICFYWCGLEPNSQYIQSMFVSVGHLYIFFEKMSTHFSFAQILIGLFFFCYYIFIINPLSNMLLLFSC